PAIADSATAQLDPKLRELAMARAGWAVGSQFVFSQHSRGSMQVGNSEEKVRSVPFYQTADCYSPLERAVLAYADDLVLNGGRVPDERMAVLKAHLSDEEILRLTYA